MANELNHSKHVGVGFTKDADDLVATVTPASVGAAPASHSHNASDITGGTLGVARGGTGRATLTSGAFLRGAGASAVTMSTPAQAKAAMGFEPFYVNPQDNGAFHIVFDEAMTLNLASVRRRGTGTVVYAKSTNGTTFSDTAVSTSFAINDVLRITVTDYSDYLTLTIPRTA